MRHVAWLLLASCTVPASRESYEPSKRLFERDGIAVLWTGSNPVRATADTDPVYADHLDVEFVVQSERSVRFSTAAACLSTQGQSFANSVPVDAELKPGESRMM